MMNAVRSFEDDDGSFHRPSHESVLRRFLGPHEFASFQQPACRLSDRRSTTRLYGARFAPPDYDNDEDVKAVLRFLGATTATQLRKLQDLRASNPDEFMNWCRQTARYQVNEWGEYPLHRACRYGGTAAQVRAIISLCPTMVSVPCASNLRNLPLHCALLAFNEPVAYLLLHVYPEALHTLNAEQGLPLHTAIASSCSDRLIRVLWHFYPGALAIPNQHKDRMTPLHLIYQHSPPKLRSAHCWIAWWLHLKSESMAPSTTSDRNPLLQSLLQALACRDAHGRLPLHVALEQGTFMSVRDFTTLLCATPLNERQDNHVDGKGNHLLHLACQSIDFKQEERGHSVIVQAIIEYFPHAVLLSNQDGQLPIHCAIRHGAPLPVTMILLPHYRPDTHGSVWEQLVPLAVGHHASLSLLFELLKKHPPSATQLSHRPV